MATDENLIKRGCIMVSICVPLSVKLLNPFSLISTLSFCVEIMALARRVVRCDICFGHNAGYFLKVIHTFHTIWMAWNGIRFNNSIFTLHAAKAKTHSSVSTSAGMMTDYFYSSTELPIFNILRLHQSSGMRQK
jgi:hypothetical protein